MTETSDGAIGDIDYSIGTTADDSLTALHIASDGRARLRRPDGSTQTAVVSPRTLADLRSEIAGAEFPQLAPRYLCEGICTLIYTPPIRVSVRLGARSYTSVTNVDYLDHGRVPDELAATIGALEQIIAQADWQ